MLLLIISSTGMAQRVVSLAEEASCVDAIARLTAGDSAKRAGQPQSAVAKYREATARIQRLRLQRWEFQAEQAELQRRRAAAKG